MRRLLILACTSRKRSDTSLLPAIQRYDGPSFRVLRKYLRSVPDEDLAVLILSAEFGLIRRDTPIPDYDRLMSFQRAEQLRSTVANQFSEFMKEIAPKKMLVSAGRTYLRALPAIEKASMRGVPVSVTDGSIGKKLTKLRDWLHGEV